MRSQITEAQKIAGGSGSEQDIAEAKIELEVSLCHTADKHIDILIYVYVLRFSRACKRP